MDPDSTPMPAVENEANLADEIEARIEKLAEVDAPDAAEVATDLAKTLADLLDQVESV